MPSYTCEFTTGHTGPIAIIGACPQFLIGLATDARGYRRCVFITDGAPHPDPWIAAVHAERPQRLAEVV